MGSIDIFGLK